MILKYFLAMCGGVDCGRREMPVIQIYGRRKINGYNRYLFLLKQL
ncbi:hypothetical protein [Sinomicrobium sp. M5D2P9]